MNSLSVFKGSLLNPGTGLKEELGFAKSSAALAVAESITGVLKVNDPLSQVISGLKVPGLSGISNVLAVAESITGVLKVNDLLSQVMSGLKVPGLSGISNGLTVGESMTGVLKVSDPLSQVMSGLKVPGLSGISNAFAVAESMMGVLKVNDPLSQVISGLKIPNFTGISAGIAATGQIHGVLWAGVSPITGLIGSQHAVDEAIFKLGIRPEITIPSALDLRITRQSNESILINPFEVEDELVCENHEYVAYCLKKLDPDLHDMWRGAYDAIRSNSYDKIRHFSASIRELMTHVLHSLAPTEMIIQWSQDSSHFHNQNPTRRARFYYIFRGSSSYLFASDRKSDVKRILDFLDDLQRGTHAKKVDWARHELISRLKKVNYILKSIFEASRF